jgi:hypothetical protein
MEYFLGFMLFIGIIIACVGCTDREGKKIDDGRYVKKIEFEGHTYIHLRNYWSSSGDKFIHDPGCKCIKEEK